MRATTALVLTFGFVAVSSPRSLADSATAYAYPKAKKGDVKDTYHGQDVPDPYRWLEEEDTPEVNAWIEAENKVTFGFLEQIPEREAIRKRLTELWDYERFNPPYKEGDRYFFAKNDGLQNQSVLYTVKAVTETPQELIDPNKWSADGTVALSGWDPTDDGRLLAYGTSAKGSDWEEWKVRDVATGKDLDDHVKWVKFSDASWTKDGKGFFYCRYDEPKDETKLKDVNYFHKLYYHKLGTPQSEDKLVYDRPDQKEWNFGASVTDDGKYLIISAAKGTERQNMVFYAELGDKVWKVTELIKQFEAQYDFIDNDGYVYYFRTDHNAPRGRVIAIDIREPQRDKWKEIIPQSEEILQSVSSVGGRLIATYLKDAYSKVMVFELDGKFVRDVSLPPFLGTAAGFAGKRDNPEVFYVFTSFNYPTTVFRYDVKTGESTVWKRPKVNIDPEKFEVKQVFYNSKDGTRVPMFICHKKGAKLDGQNPTLLYGYGGFNASITPNFSVRNLTWMDMGGVYAVANLRGGGEYGKDWHEAGKKLKKQNVFDDFIAAGEWLIKNKYTSPEKLAIHGGSNGGLLVGACMTQRPDLFGATLPAVGVMDMLRFNKFTIGWAWTSDYGSPDNADEFKALYAYSPLHNLKPGTAYPATLITTADHDDRVWPGHSFKFAARLQEVQSGPEPVLIRVQTKAGHGAGKPTRMQIDETADMWSFLVKTLDMKVDLPGVSAPKPKEKPSPAG